MNSTILTHIDERGIATLTMNRSELHNAFDELLIDELTDELKRLAVDDRVRVVRLAGSGKSYSAGADLNWMRRMAAYTREQNLADAMALAGLMETLNGLNKPTIALVHGATYGGGVGLVACCDMALSVKQVSFCLAEARRPAVRSTPAERPLRHGRGQTADRRSFRVPVGRCVDMPHCGKDCRPAGFRGRAGRAVGFSGEAQARVDQGVNIHG